MTTHSSAIEREQTPHVTETSTTTISNSLKRRAQSVINDRSINAQSRMLIRYGLETNDPWLAELVRRVDAGETIIETINFSQTPAANEDYSSDETIEALTEIICRADEPGTKWAAMLVLMATLENAAHPKALANTAKHLAFTHCGELNLKGMVDAQIAMLEGELLAGNTGLC